MSLNGAPRKCLRRLRVLTLNIFVRPPGITTRGNDYKSERLALLVLWLASYDVVCLQELFGCPSSRRAHFLGLAARRAGLRYSCSLPNKLLGSLPPRIIPGGVSVLSRWPIVDWDYIIYDDVAMFSADAWVAKGALYAQIAVPFAGSDAGTSDSSVRVHVFSTHLQSSGDARSRFARVREQQARALMRFIRRKTVGDEQSAVVVAGDFNANGRAGPTDAGDGPEYLHMSIVLRQAGAFRDVLREAHGGEHPVTVGDAHVDPSTGVLEIVDHVLTERRNRGCRKRLDYIWVDTRDSNWQDSGDAHVCPFRVDGHPFAQLSDHYGVAVTLNYYSSDEDLCRPSPRHDPAEQ